MKNIFSKVDAVEPPAGTMRFLFSLPIPDEMWAVWNEVSLLAVDESAIEFWMRKVMPNHD